MCFMTNKPAIDPIRIVLQRQRAPNGALVETQTLALAKVTGITRDGDHISYNNFVYPIGQTVYDPYATVGSHTNCLHFLPSVECAPDYNDLGGHVVIVVPGPHLWDLPEASGEPPAQCWHSDSCTPLFCASCHNLTSDDLKNDLFWRDLTIPRRRYGLSPARNSGYALPVPRNNVWHQQVQVNPYPYETAGYNGQYVPAYR